MPEIIERISLGDTNYLPSMVTMVYCPPHGHREIEVGTVLEGNARVITKTDDVPVTAGDLYINNPYSAHEFVTRTPGKPFTILQLQIPAAFFSEYFPSMENVRFDFGAYNAENTEGFDGIRFLLLRTALRFFEKGPYYELACAGLIDLLFARLLTRIPHKVLTENERESLNAGVIHMRHAIAYIDENFDRKLLLSEIAEQEGVTVNYLSHLFSDLMGMPFQEYLMRVRCGRAARMLSTDLSLLDISISCGFSDPKYFNAWFERCYTVTPREFREEYAGTDLTEVGISPNSTLPLHLPEETALESLKKYLGDNTEAGRSLLK